MMVQTNDRSISTYDLVRGQLPRSDPKPKEEKTRKRYAPLRCAINVPHI